MLSPWSTTRLCEPFPPPLSAAAGQTRRGEQPTLVSSLTHIHTRASTQSAPVCCSQNKQAHTLGNAQSPFPSCSLLLTLASQFASELSHSGLYILFNNILSPRWVPLRADLTVQCAACLLRKSRPAGSCDGLVNTFLAQFHWNYSCNLNRDVNCCLIWFLF